MGFEFGTRPSEQITLRQLSSKKPVNLQLFTANPNSQINPR